jgi:hypothetical protein
VKARRAHLAERRAALVARSASERELLTEIAAEITGRLDRIDQRINAVRRFLHRPWLLFGGVAAIALLLGPRKLLRVAARGAVWVSTAQRVVKLVHR